MSNFNFKSGRGLRFKTEPLLGEGLGNGAEAFKIGAVVGVWQPVLLSLDILSIYNTNPGNGDMDDAMQGILAYARFLRLPVRVLNIPTPIFKIQLLRTWGYLPCRVEKMMIKYDHLDLMPGIIPSVPDPAQGLTKLQIQIARATGRVPKARP